MTATESHTLTDARIERLSGLSLKRVVEPDELLPGELGPGQILPDELLSIAGLGLDLTADQRATLSREEVASIAANGVRFEAVLAAGFSLEILRHEDLTDPRVTYILHELGEETRHSRLFVRMIGQLAPKARNPIDRRVLHRRAEPRPSSPHAPARVLLRARAHGRRDPRPLPEARVRASRHRPVPPRGQSVPPPRRSAAPELRAHVASRALREGDALRTLPDPPPRAAAPRPACSTCSCTPACTR